MESTLEKSGYEGVLPHFVALTFSWTEEIADVFAFSIDITVETSRLKS